MNILSDYKEQFVQAIEHLKRDILTLRTGRATPALVEDILVEAYGTKQPLKSVASIVALDAKTIAVEPWDKSIIKYIDAALMNSQLGINPVNDGKIIRLPLPDLTSERRQELIKVLHQKLEQARISVRKIREDIRKEIDKAEDAGDIAEDEKFKLQDLLETMVKEYNEEIKTIGAEKEVDIQKV
jgi:ribosome recycling factor